MWIRGYRGYKDIYVGYKDTWIRGYRGYIQRYVDTRIQGVQGYVGYKGTWDDMWDTRTRIQGICGIQVYMG